MKVKTKVHSAKLNNVYGKILEGFMKTQLHKLINQFISFADKSSICSRQTDTTSWRQYLAMSWAYWIFGISTCNSTERT